MFWNDGWHMGGMWVWWILVIAGVVALSWFLASVSRRGPGRGDGGDNAEQTLKRRYARGEIDRETYERMLADLRK